jgi:hypothetical protein
MKMGKPKKISSRKKSKKLLSSLEVQKNEKGKVRWL